MDVKPTLTVTTVWNTGETGDIYLAIRKASNLLLLCSCFSLCKVFCVQEFNSWFQKYNRIFTKYCNTFKDTIPIQNFFFTALYFIETLLNLLLNKLMWSWKFPSLLIIPMRNLYLIIKLHLISYKGYFWLSALNSAGPIQNMEFSLSKQICAQAKNLNVLLLHCFTSFNFGLTSLLEKWCPYCCPRQAW